MAEVDTSLEVYFRLYFIMAEVGNLDICLGRVTLAYFHNGRGG
jgi:hypothetical protein